MPKSSTHDSELLQYAIRGLEEQKRQIEEKIADLRQRGGQPTYTAKSATAKKRGRPKRTMSAEAREKIAEAQRKRWAASRPDSPAASKKSAGTKKRRTLSPEARERMAAAQRKRWATKKA